MPPVGVCGRALKVAAIALLLLLPLGAQAPVDAEAPNAPIHFAAVDVWIDSGPQALAAWQFELAAETGSVKIVGIEGGEHPAYQTPPYYDPAAMQHDRVILAAFHTGNDLPKGRTRVARIHVQVTGNTQPEYAVRLDTAGSPDGQRIEAKVSLEKGEAR